MCRNDYIVISAVYRERHLEMEKQIVDIEKELFRYWEEESSQNKEICKELGLENMTIEDRIRFGGIKYIKNNGAI